MLIADLQKFQRMTGIHFTDQKLLREALTHKSYATEFNLKYDNQRLEFLGDAVVQIVLTKHLFHRYPGLQEGDLTKIRSALVNQDTLAKFARSISLGSYLMLGRGETESHGCDRDSTLSDAFEAVCGAIYLDQGSALVTEFILKTLHTNCREPSDLLHSLNPKGLLQEYAQAHFGKAPEYKILGVSGPAHNPCYEVEVLVNFLQRALRQSASLRNRLPPKPPWKCFPLKGRITPDRVVLQFRQLLAVPDEFCRISSRRLWEYCRIPVSLL